MGQRSEIKRRYDPFLQRGVVYSRPLCRFSFFCASFSHGVTLFHIRCCFVSHTVQPQDCRTAVHGMFAARALLSWAVGLVVAGSTLLAEPPLRRCFTQPDDFLPGALHGTWSGISPEEWDAEEKAGRRRKVRRKSVGNLTVLVLSSNSLNRPLCTFLTA